MPPYVFKIIVTLIRKDKKHYKVKIYMAGPLFEIELTLPKNLEDDEWYTFKQIKKHMWEELKIPLPGYKHFVWQIDISDKQFNQIARLIMRPTSDDRIAVSQGGDLLMKIVLELYRSNMTKPPKFCVNSYTIYSTFMNGDEYTKPAKNDNQKILIPGGTLTSWRKLRKIVLNKFNVKLPREVDKIDWHRNTVYYNTSIGTFTQEL